MADAEARVESADERSTTEEDKHLVSSVLRKRNNKAKKQAADLTETDGADNSERKHKPYDNRWIQQKIPACRPIWHPLQAVALFLATSVVFTGLGIVFLVTSLNTRETSMDYTDCPSVENSSLSCDRYIAAEMAGFNGSRVAFPTCTCRLQLTVSAELERLRAPVHVYYGLSNYYQNHRRFLQSWSVTQINSQTDVDLRQTADCNPLKTAQDADGAQQPVVPCGLRMNSAFNDTFQLKRVSDGSSLYINETSIAWPVDKTVRFSRLNITRDRLRNDTVQPPNWPLPLDQVPEGLQNEHNIVWFRASAFQWLRKLYGRIHDDVTAGTYTLELQYNYRVSMFGGRKLFILSEVSWLGGRNHFLGIAYLVVGGLSCVGGVLMAVIHCTCSKWRDSHKNYHDIVKAAEM